MEEWIVGMKKDRVAPSCFSCGFGYDSDRGMYIEDVEGIRGTRERKAGKPQTSTKALFCKGKWSEQAPLPAFLARGGWGLLIFSSKDIR